MTLSRKLFGALFLICAAAVLLVLAIVFTPSSAGASGGSGGSGGSTSASCPPFSTAPPVAESVAGYSSAALPLLYPDPNDDYGGTIPGSVVAAWYNGMPAPGICSSGSQGLCITDDFSSAQGTRVAALTASTTNLVFGAPRPIQASVDAATHQISNTCGDTATQWSWVVTPSASTQTAYFPTNTQIEVSYSCEPNQTYAWETSSSCLWGIGSCNVQKHARTFFFADQAQATNIPAVSSLYGKTDFTPTAGSTYTLACGGYRPENGDATPPSYGSQSTSNGVCLFGIDCSAGTDFASYNVADPSYWQPGITLSVNVCSDDDDIVINNVCTPCSTVKPGSHRLDNVCVVSTPTLGIDALVSGKSVSSVTVGTKITIQATYVNDKSDPITATDITGGAGGASGSVCGTRNCQTTYAYNKSAATSTYAFTPTTIGTYTFYPQVETKTLNILQDYGNAAKTVTVTAPCPSNAKQSGNTCVCTTQYFTYIGNSCVLSCPSTMHSNGAGSGCVANLPSVNDITFSAMHVRSGSPSTLTWTVANLRSGVTCDITPHPGLASTALTWPSGSVQTVPITQPTTYTLTCGNGSDAPVSKDATVTLIPAYQEI